MHSFLRAEWKTILAIVIFGGALFSWFYIEEIEKAKKAAEPYAYTCVQAGVGLFDYRLGTPLAEMAPSMADFRQSRDDSLDVVRYERNDGTIALNFRSGTLASIEYLPGESGPDPACEADLREFTGSHSPFTESIPANGQRWILYEGLVVIERIEQPEAHDGESPDTREGPTEVPGKTDIRGDMAHKIGWIVTHK